MPRGTTLIHRQLALPTLTSIRCPADGEYSCGITAACRCSLLHAGRQPENGLSVGTVRCTAPEGIRNISPSRLSAAGSSLSVLICSYLFHSTPLIQLHPSIRSIPVNVNREGNLKRTLNFPVFYCENDGTLYNEDNVGRLAGRYDGNRVQIQTGRRQDYGIYGQSRQRDFFTCG